MKRIVLALVVAIVACVVVFAAQDVKRASVTATLPSLEQTNSDGFRKIDMQHLPHAVLRTMGTSASYKDCTFDGAYVSSVAGQVTYKIEVTNPDRTERFVLMNRWGEVIG